MNTFYGSWSPLSGKLPDTDDLDFAAYFISDTGTLNDILYEKDKWLVYICTARGTDSEEKIWRVSDGLVTFAPRENVNIPDPGFYTKVRLDNAGNIVAASDIQYEDLPQELHRKLKLIEDENINNLISKQLSSLFKNSTLNPVKLQYDQNTKTISASLDIDEDTLRINEFGQLAANGSSVEVHVPTEGLTQRISKIEDTLVKLEPVAGKGVKITAEAGGKVISIDIDEDSLTYNENGKLCVSPEALTNYFSASTGAQEVKASDIIGLSSFISEALGDNAAIASSVRNSLSNLIDEETIVINRDGKLESIATHVQKHKHTLSDITDLNPAKADTWASSQRLHQSNSNQNFNSGAVVMSSLTIGEVLIAFNELLKEQSETLELLENRASGAEPIEPSRIEGAIIENFSTLIDGYDVMTKETVKVTERAVVGTSSIVYEDGSVLEAYVDGKLRGKLRAFSDSDITFSTGRFGDFIVTYEGDAYPKDKALQNHYRGFSFKYNAPLLEEGEHAVQFTQRSLDGKIVSKSDILKVRTFTQSDAKCTAEFVKWPSYNRFVSGIAASNETNPEISAKISVRAFSKRYVPSSIISCLMNDTSKNISEYEYNDSAHICEYTASFSLPENTNGVQELLVETPKWNGEKQTFKFTTQWINIDNSDEETYRVTPDFITAPLEDDTIYRFTSFDPSADLGATELQLIKHKLMISKDNYTKRGIGPDYSNHTSPQSATFMFDCPRSLRNLYIDFTDENGNAFSTDKNGCLKGIGLYVGLSDSMDVNRWTDGNKPYKGYGGWSSSSIHSGLDLAKSNDIRKWITFGESPSIKGNKLFLRVVSYGKSIDAKRMISSLKECLNER